MAQQHKIPYTTQITSLDRRITAIEQHIQAEKDLIASIKRPGALLQALMSARVRQDALREVYRRRGTIAQLERDLAQTRAEQEELKRLCALYPEHDRLIEQAEQVRYRSWHLSLQEEERRVTRKQHELAQRQAKQASQQRALEKKR